MVYMNERYYLICVPDHAPNTRLYRIDRMKDIQILDDPRSEAVAVRRHKMLSMPMSAHLSASSCTVTHDFRRCDRPLRHGCTDREHDENTFTASFTAPPRRQILGTAIPTVCRVVEPAWLRQKIIESSERTSITNRHNLSDIVLLKACVLGGYDTDKW